MKRLKIDLSDKDYEDLKGLLYDVYESPFADSHIAEVMLKQIEDNEY